MILPHPVYTPKQQASLIKRSKRKGYKAQWKAGESRPRGWRDCDWPLTPAWFNASKTDDGPICYNLYRVVKIK